MIEVGGAGAGSGGDLGAVVGVGGWSKQVRYVPVADAPVSSPQTAVVSESPRRRWEQQQMRQPGN
jgi:hypothetical protein